MSVPAGVDVAGRNVSANGFGLDDMIGNVWERVSDVFVPRHDTGVGPVIDADGRPDLLSPTTSPRVMRVTKGGRFCVRPSTASAIVRRPARPSPTIRPPRTSDSLRRRSLTPVATGRTTSCRTTRVGGFVPPTATVDGVSGIANWL